MPHRKLGAAVGFYLAFRYSLFDGYLTAWDAGWRPWHFNALRRATNLMVRVLRAVPTPARPATPANASSIPIERPALPPILPRLEVAARMRLYRFYAFVGRRKLGWGIRARIRARLRKMFGRDPERPQLPILPRLEIAARMRLYRFYAFVGRQKLGWGIRARIRARLRKMLR